MFVRLALSPPVPTRSLLIAPFLLLCVQFATNERKTGLVIFLFDETALNTPNTLDKKTLTRDRATSSLARSSSPPSRLFALAPPPPLLLRRRPAAPPSPLLLRRPPLLPQGTEGDGDLSERGWIGKGV